MDPSTIMNPATLPPGIFGLLLEPGVLLAVWSAFVVIALAGLTAVLGMESRQQRADRRAVPRPYIVSRTPEAERAAA
jgi:hypothetical protein